MAPGDRFGNHADTLAQLIHHSRLAHYPFPYLFFTFVAASHAFSREWYPHRGGGPTPLRVFPPPFVSSFPAGPAASRAYGAALLHPLRPQKRLDLLSTRAFSEIRSSTSLRSPTPSVRVPQSLRRDAFVLRCSVGRPFNPQFLRAPERDVGIEFEGLVL